MEACIIGRDQGVDRAGPRAVPEIGSGPARSQRRSTLMKRLSETITVAAIAERGIFRRSDEDEIQINRRLVGAIVGSADRRSSPRGTGCAPG
jgi:hypothetical protein